MSPGAPARFRSAGLVLAAALVLSGCAPDAEVPITDVTGTGSPTASLSPGTEAGGPVRIATGVSDQTRVIAYMYAQELEEQGIAAQVVDLGTERGQLVNAVRDGKAEVVPEFTGDLYVHVRETQQPTASATPTEGASPATSGGPDLIGSLAQLLGFTGETGPTDNDVHQALPDALPSGLRVLDQSPGENTERFVVTAATAVEYELGDLGTVEERCPKLVVGLPQDTGDSAQAAAGLKAYYNCKPKAIREYAAPSQRADALLNNEVQAAVLPASLPVINDDGLKVLDDPDHLYRPEKVVPLTTETLTDEVVSTLNGVTTGIHTEDLTTMTRLTSGRPADMTPQEAAAFIREQPR